MNHNTDLTVWPDAQASQYRELGYWQDRTLLDYFRQTAAQYPEQPAVICQDRTFTYRDMDQHIGRLAAGFKALGLMPGDNVVLQMTNVAEFYTCFFALLQLGVRPVLALPAHRQAEITYFCDHAEAKAYLIDGASAAFDYQALARDVAANCPGLQHVIVRGELAPTDDPRFIRLADCEQVPDTAQNANPSDIAFFQLSGGTTGTPKLIPRTHNDYAYSVTGSVDICQFSPETRYLCALPVAHNFPLSSPGALGVFWAGGCVVLTQNPAPQAAFELIEKHRVTVSALVPPLALLWMDHVDNTRHDLSSLKLIQVGGAKFSETAAKALPGKLNCQLQQVFGMAEGLVNYTRLDDPIEVITQTQGRPISPHDQIRVVDDAGQDVAIGEEGFLLTQGPYTIRGYYRAPAHNERSFNQDGFYRTGDIVKRTAEGNLIVTGRDKDQINRGGEKIAAEEIENQLLRHEGIHDAALIAIPDEYLGERSCAVIVTRPGIELRPIALKRFLRDLGIADYKIPDKIAFSEALPKTSVGKIDKKVLRATYA
ncbi:(2,3-dihydroxybenzoyl)adenylate synthase [Photobacterium atrarenae]|uniref:(2,3-dihydroxybenzoyl)adenylate synthase n=1 Tax=Photobacterium atrarenae TaxID=865757 RepID=A0ABY5GNP5_9GAMM|nr:(2,3-dihydroxybenzoyl)adenylate synthase [Photobacterium atrarenae]UTV30751.1 (2,3-dihydroxybenzoyl)adenylate synthase [Photobacterium atrarenae]